MAAIQPIPAKGFFQEISVLHKCANPNCSSLFRNLGHGKLFLLDSDISGPLRAGLLWCGWLAADYTARAD
jgi:hypothetical protein